jgi:MoaA/NifB/PqqE/SkfB family radical SAM enzyme
MTSDYFFETLPGFYETRRVDGCQAGKIMIHVSPKGMVQPCAELPAVAHYSEFLPGAYAGPNCGACFDACRSEPQAPLTLRRLGELTGVL